MATLRCSDCGKPDIHLTDFFLVPDKSVGRAVPARRYSLSGLLRKAAQSSQPSTGPAALGCRDSPPAQTVQVEECQPMVGGTKGLERCTGEAT